MKFNFLQKQTSRREMLRGSAGQSAQEAIAEKPFADLDPVWGNGVVNGDQWVQIVYLSL